MNTIVRSTIYLDRILCGRNPIPVSDLSHDLKVGDFSLIPI